MKAEDTLAARRTKSAVHADSVYSQSFIYNALHSIAQSWSFVRILSGLARAAVKEKNKENCNLGYLKGNKLFFSVHQWWSFQQR